MYNYGISYPFLGHKERAYMERVMKEQVSQYEQVIAKLKKENKDLKKRINELEKRIKELEEELNTLRKSS